jgi:shikimate dehydrogenase
MRRFAVIGQSLKHSFSPAYFKQKFEQLGLTDHSYEAVECPSLDDVRTLLQTRQLDGFNVTIPYKKSILSLLDDVSEDARAMGAVNTVVLRGKQWIGHNTDWIGFRTALVEMVNEQQMPQKALVIGNGGAAQAVLYALRSLGIQTRTVARTGGDTNLTELKASEVRAADLLVQTTPIGMYPNEEACIDFPFEAVTGKHLVIDLIYNPLETLFMKRCRLAGARVQNGFRMLALQADHAWEIWTT